MRRFQAVGSFRVRSYDALLSDGSPLRLERRALATRTKVFTEEECKAYELQIKPPRKAIAKGP